MNFSEFVINVLSKAVTAVVLLLLLVLVLIALTTTIVMAQESSRKVSGDNGEYRLDIGFQNEPAYEGVFNAVQLTITSLNGGIVDLGDTKLDVEIVYVPTDDSILLELVPNQIEPNVFLAEFLPSLSGDYSFRIMGKLDGAAVDELFTSGPTTFNPVEPSSVVAFPSQPSLRELSNSATANQIATTNLEHRFDGLTIGIWAVGAAMGILVFGLLVVLWSVRRLTAHQIEKNKKEL